MSEGCVGVDVANLTQYDDTALAAEESGGRCLYYGMKLRIDIEGGRLLRLFGDSNNGFCLTATTPVPGKV